MPCWQELVYEVDFRVANTSWLYQALVEMPNITSVQEKSDGTITATFNSDRVVIDTVASTIRGPQELIAAIKEQYAKTAVSKQISRFGWSIKWTGKTAKVQRIRYG